METISGKSTKNHLLNDTILLSLFIDLKSDIIIKEDFGICSFNKQND
jgi:hypothetical protein